ncbi:MAG: TetR/AcrR family transcriptional regulator [Acidobacteriota bacterium]
MSKGRETRQAILYRAVDLTSQVGLEGLSIGVLAKRAGMSKSGLYAHFGSKEELQREVLDAAADRFVDVVMAPAFREPRGLPRVERLFELWMWWGTQELSGGCPFVAAASDFEDRLGPVRDHLIVHLDDLLKEVAKTAQIAIDEGHFRPDLDVQQFAYEFWALVVVHQHYSKLFGYPRANERARAAFERMVRDACQAPVH